MAMWLLVFFINALLDVVYAQYTIQVQARNAHQAGLYAFGIIVFGGVSILSYTQQPWLLIPAAIGAYVGTWVTIYVNIKSQ